MQLDIFSLSPTNPSGELPRPILEIDPKVEEAIAALQSLKELAIEPKEEALPTRKSFKHRQTVYISDPYFPRYREGSFTGWLTEGPRLAIAYVEVFEKSSRKKDHLETICVSEEYLSSIPPVNINYR